MKRIPDPSLPRSTTNSSSSFYVSNPRRQCTGSGRSLATLAGSMDVHILSVSADQMIKVCKTLRATQSSEVILITSLVAITAVVPHLIQSCVDHPQFLQHLLFSRITYQTEGTNCMHGGSHGEIQAKAFQRKSLGWQQL